MRLPSRERPVGLFFGEPGRVMNGFFHAPLRALETDVVVVLCKPIGWEAIAANRAWRELAERLADAGFPVLRFDYLGTGDSSGTDADPERVSEWQHSIQLAILEAQRLSGKSKVGLVGLHLGATLAMLAALRHGGVASLVMWAPYLTGRAYAREAKVYRALNDPGPGFPRAEDEGGLEAAGFLLTAATLAQLSELNLRAEKRAPAPHVLLLARENSNAEQQLAEHLVGLATEVTHSASPGYADLMQDPRKSVLPEQEIATIVAYLSRAHAGPRQLTAPSPLGTHDLRQQDCVEICADGTRVVERLLSFGPEGRFFGIFTEPEGVTETRSRPVVMLLNTAPHTRIGPSRMYVPMARQMAAAGFPVLRFDLNGVGDSGVNPGAERNPIYSKAFVKDVQQAMNALEQDGYQRFVAVGLCSGAYLAFHSALADRRIEGVAIVNAQTFDWKDGDSLEVKRRDSVMSNNFYKRAILQPQTWVRAAKGEIDFRTIGRALLNRAQHRAGVEVRRALTSLGAIGTEEWLDVARSFEELLRRGTRTYLVYSEDDEGVDHLRSQVGTRMNYLQRSDRFRLESVKGADHTFSQVWAQKLLRELLVEDLKRNFRDAGPPAATRASNRPPRPV